MSREKRIREASVDVIAENPFLPEDFEKRVKRNFRKLKFKVGEEICEEGTVERSFALRDMEKMRQILKYKPNDKRFNM